MIATSFLQLVNLIWLNKRKERLRVRNGKPAQYRDLSMTKHFVASGATDHDTIGGAGPTPAMGGNAFKDLTDGENDEFNFIY